MCVNFLTYHSYNKKVMEFEFLMLKINGTSKSKELKIHSRNKILSSHNCPENQNEFIFQCGDSDGLSFVLISFPKLGLCCLMLIHPIIFVLEDCFESQMV